jgi:phthiocerol/phenolphthiocerol synthesis type-I polyketide synthase E
MSQAIAIIGMAGRFPRSASVEALWEHVRAGRELISFFSDEEIRAAGVPDAVRRLPGYVNARAILDEPERFDARFFGISPAEATLTDPQHRVFLECCHDAFENAGYDPRRVEELVGVYAGADVGSYAAGHLLLWTHDLSTLIGNDKDYLATRVAYKLDLRGPAVTIQTACSTSLVAVQLATRALLDYQCDFALAGGVGIAFPQRAGYVYQEGGILSPDGHCRPFDAAARGTVGGDGCGVVLLRRLEDALASRDPIRAVILGAAVNNDGAKKMAFSAPSVEGQAEVIALAHAVADVDPDSIGYVEAHGTATPLGDPIELTALTEAFRAKTARVGYCALGSLKSNLGHMNSAAGIGGLVKAVLALEHGEIPPSLHFEAPNPQLELAGSPFYVSRELQPWPRLEGPRRAGVSSFGVGGTNAHVVLEEAPSFSREATAQRAHLLFFSARSDAALAARAEGLATHLAAHPELELADVAHTLFAGRARFERRAFVVAWDREQALVRLGLGVRATTGPDECSLVFLFPGQGSQVPHMAAGLYRDEPRFRAHLDRNLDLVAAELGERLEPLLWGGEGKLERTLHVQPALFAVEHALGAFLLELGAAPAALVGHSVGELVAAVLAEVLSLEDALKLVVVRARAMEDLPAGAMLAVGLPEAEARELPGLSVAAQNAPDLTVLSGPVEAIVEAEKALRARRVATTRLAAQRAFHSPMMEPVVAPLRSLLEKMPLSAPKIPILSTVTGHPLTAEEARDPGYWAAHLRRPVRFADALAAAAALPHATFVEVGPGRTLSALARRQGVPGVVPTMRVAEDDSEDLEVFLAALGALYGAGAALSPGRLYDGEARRRVALPTYPFQRETYSQRAIVPAALSAASLEGVLPTGLFAPSWQRIPAGKAAPLGTWLGLCEEGQSPFDGLATPLRSLAALREQAAALRPEGIVVSGPWDADPRRALGRLLAVANALPEVPCRLVVALQGSADVLGDEALSPTAMALAAACRVLAQEMPHLACSALDVGQASPHALREALGAIRPGAHEALRGAARFAELLVPCPRGGAVAPLRTGEVVVILGGLGGIGLTLAEHLARTCRTPLLLTSRTGLPAEDTWAGWLEGHRVDDPVSQRIRRVSAMRAAGTPVLVGSLELRDGERLAALFERARAELGPVGLVLHAAGVAGNEAFRALGETSALDIERLFRAKHEGLHTLLEALPESVHTVLFTSSLSAAIGGVGLAAYAAANAYLDGVVTQRARQGGRRLLAIDWDAVSSTQATQAAPSAPSRALDPGELASLFDEALAVPGASRLVVVKGSLEARLAAASARTGAAPAPTEDPASRQKHPRPDLGVAYVGPRNETERLLAEIWSEVLAIETIGVHDNFFKLGGDSLLAIQVSARIRSALGVELPVGELFEEATVEAVATRVDAKRREKQASEGALLEQLALVENLSDDEVRRMLEELEGRRG